MSTTNPTLNVAGAEWCPWSNRQATALGCNTVDGVTSCKAKQDSGASVNFVFCQDKERKPINQDHPICKQIAEKPDMIGGYPAWFNDQEVSKNIGGFTDPCAIPSMNKEQLQCGAIEAANQTCEVAKKKSMEKTVTLQRELEDAGKEMQEKIAKLEKEIIQPRIKAIEELIQPEKQECEDAQKSAQVDWGHD